jgi:hypothetical protein
MLLPLPLILLVNGALQPALPETGPGGRHISPVLEKKDRLLLSTYHRDCAVSSECEPPLGCVTDTRYFMQYCTDSECTTDAQCPDDLVCQNISTTGEGPLVRFCVPVGRRQEGEQCLKLPGNRDEACAAGLLCGGAQPHWCGRPCHPGDAASCPTGFFCANTVPEPVCLPTCEERGCPVGQHCIQFDEGVSVCAKRYGPDCQQSPCSQGRKCQVEVEPTLPGKAWLECVERCGEDFPPCAEGMTCDGWQCKPACTPQTSDPCGEGYHCIQRRPDRPFVCMPESWQLP